MARRRRKGTLRYGILSVLIATVLWSVAHTSSSLERGYDIPVVFEDLPEDLVITDQSDSEINIRVLGSRAALRNFSPTQLEYLVNTSGAKTGRTVHEVDVTRLDLPRGVRIVSRSPAQLDVRFERRGRKSVRVRPDTEGEPAAGYRVRSVEVKPAKVWLTGARSRVMRLSEVVTETIDLAGLDAPVERQVKLNPGSDLVWTESREPVTVRVEIEPLAPPVAESADQGAGSSG